MCNYRIVLITLLIFLHVVTSEILNDDFNSTTSEYQLNNGRLKSLSRRKRFVIFPDGSSLQVVFCMQSLAYIPIGDIFIFGYTAALAWSLPSDTKYFNLFKEYERPLRRSDQVTKTINYLDEDGRIIGRVPYKKRIIVNPAFSKRSVENDEISLNEKTKIDKKKMHEEHINKDYLKTEDMDKDTIEFHRMNRLELYKKLETLTSALGRNGRQCILYKLCQAAQQRREQGTFLEELHKAVFTLPKGYGINQDEFKEYDAAHTASDDCFARYPGCTDD